jgi:uncharacterized membrane protein
MTAFLMVFIAYQLYRIALTPTAWLIALTIFDAFVAWLTWREWFKQRSRQHPPRPVRVRPQPSTR